MRRIRLTVAYDGTDYCGWQIQKDKPTVEGMLTQAVCALTGETAEAIGLTGAGRTDSGVHARGNVAVFDTVSGIPGERFAFAVNQKLPPDIRVVRSEECAPDWHPRKRESEKVYVYRFYNDRIEDPLLRRYAAHTYYRLDLEKMRAAAAFIEGEHDFTSFTNPDSQILKNGGSAVRTVFGISIEAERGQKETGMHGLITITVRGSGFLYNMVRIIAGTLHDAGTGRIKPEDIPAILEARSRSAAGPTAEARGLMLERIVYEDDEK